MMPINSGTKKRWWGRQKLVSRDNGQSIQRWKNLSPDNPPLPFIVPQPTFKSSELDQPTSEIAPTKDDEFIPSASLYIPHDKIYPYNRDLYTIAELSEINTTNSFASSHDPSYTNSSSSSSHGNGLYVPPQTSPIVTQPPVVKSSSSELDKKKIFHQMLQLRIGDKEYPKKLQLLFNNENNLEGILFIAFDGKRQKIRFNGTPQSIPPELLICDTYNHELTSVWVLGILLYHMLVGKYPFDKHVTHMGLFNQMLDPNFVTIPDTLSTEAQDLLKHMLRPDPSKRASFDFIQHHPWVTSAKPKKTKRKKALQFVKKVANFVLKGPYPPPLPYRK
ncbi:kinase-like domain-containing protein [Thamnidium elegans]|nr:kinase-like domain-containing protein [Thamnidium elegans]